MAEDNDSVMSWRYVPRRRRILPGDPFFKEGNLETCLAHKQMPVEETDYESNHTRHDDFKCHVIGCNQSFTTVQSYEIHYNGAHRNTCRFCRKAYPSNHLLDIHILESHDTLFEVMTHKQPMYRCLVESCSERFPDSQTRREHLIQQHQYPADFRFQRGMSKPWSKGKSKEISHTDAMEVESAKDGDTENDIHVSHAIQGGVSLATQGNKPPAENKQHRVPVNICFGRGGTRSFQRGHQKQQNKTSRPKGHAQKQKDNTFKEKSHTSKDRDHTYRDERHAPKEEPMDALKPENIDESRVNDLNNETGPELMTIGNEYL